jgi:hypothetical protein
VSDPQSSHVASSPKVEVPEPWPPGEATHRLRNIATDPYFEVSFKLHAEDQMGDRGITLPDVICAMRNGFVYEKAEPARQPGLYRYTMRGASLSLDKRDIKVVVIPSMHKASLKIVTVMWADEAGVKG